MHTRIALGSLRIYLSITKRQPVLGVNSILADGEHVLLLDFDEVPSPTELEDGLNSFARWHRLPPIYVVESSEGKYHGYCYHRLDWQRAALLMADCPYVDDMHQRLGIMRQYWTLRISDKAEWYMRRAFATGGYAAETAEPGELQSFVQYDSKI